MKKILAILLTLCSLVVGFDYGKHVYVLYRLKKEYPEFIFKGGGVSLSNHRWGFRIAISSIESPYGSVEDMRIAIPFLSFSQAFLRGSHVNLKGLQADGFRASVEFKDETKIEYIELRECFYNFGGQHLKANTLSLNGSLGEKRARLTFFANKIHREGGDPFNFSAVSDIRNPMTDEGRGDIKVRVSSINKFFGVLTGNGFLKHQEAQLLESAFQDNVVIPLDVKGRDIFLGPFKLYEMPQKEK